MTCAHCHAAIQEEPYICPEPDCLRRLCCWECYEAHRTECRGGRR